LLDLCVWANMSEEVDMLRNTSGVTLSSATAKKGIFGHGWFIGVLSRSLIN